MWEEKICDEEESIGEAGFHTALRASRFGKNEFAVSQLGGKWFAEAIDGVLISVRKQKMEGLAGSTIWMIKVKSFYDAGLKQ